jgi:alpha-L-fucosidase
MNRMVFELQPNIIVNNRNKLSGDFSTPEQHIQAEKGRRAWESCMTMNDSWGYQKADDDWKSPKTVVRNLATCAEGGGNYLLNIGPKGDGTIPEESVRILTRAGQWLQKHGETIYQSEPCQVSRSVFSEFTRKGNTLYAHVYFWPGSTFGIGGLKTKVLSAKILATGQKAQFTQDDFRLNFTGLPVSAPDDLDTVIALECESEPVQDMLNVRENRPRDQA